MNISKYLVAAALSFCAFGNLSAADSVKNSKRYYLDEQTISVTKDGIVVKTKDGAFRVKALHCDAKGLYVFQQECQRLKGGAWGPNVLRKRCSCGAIFNSYEEWERHVRSGRCPDHPRGR